MILSQVLWWLVLLPLACIALAQLLGAAVLWVPESIPWPLGGRSTEVARTSNSLAASVAQVVMTFLLIEAGCGFTAFITAAKPPATQKAVRVRDQASAALHSVTGRWFLFAAAMAALLSIELPRPADTARTSICLVILGLLIAAWIGVLRGIQLISATNRREPFFSGLTDEQKVLAENPWPTRSKPTFPHPGQLGSVDDALRYARRAHDIARLHEWIGGGIIALATAVLGAAAAQFFLPISDISPWITALIALAAMGLGYAIHQRGGQYSRLRERFEHSAEILKQAHLDARSSDRGVRGWIRRLLG